MRIVWPCKILAWPGEIPAWRISLPCEISAGGLPGLAKSLLADSLALRNPCWWTPVLQSLCPADSLALQNIVLQNLYLQTPWPCKIYTLQTLWPYKNPALHSPWPCTSFAWRNPCPANSQVPPLQSASCKLRSSVTVDWEGILCRSSLRTPKLPRCRVLPAN